MAHVKNGRIRRGASKTVVSAEAWAKNYVPLAMFHDTVSMVFVLCSMTLGLLASALESGPPRAETHDSSSKTS